MSKFFKYILNIIPIINLSNDDHFGSLDRFSDLRISLLSFHAGSQVFHFLSLLAFKSSGESFSVSLFKSVLLDDIHQYSDAYLKDKCKKFVSELSRKNDTEVSLIVDYIKEKNGATRDPISILNDKIIANLSILTASTAFVAYLFNESIKVDITATHMAVLFMTLFILAETSLVIFDGIRTRATSKSTVKDLMDSTTIKTVAENLYFDLLNFSRTSNQLATNVLNARKFLMALFLLLFMLFFIVSAKGGEAKLYTSDGEASFFVRSSQLDISSIVEIGRKTNDYDAVIISCRNDDGNCDALADFLVFLGKEVKVTKVSEKFLGNDLILINNVGR